MTIISNLKAVPKGYTYYDESANKNYYWGEIIPTPGEGDELWSLANGDATVDHSYTFYNNLQWGGISEGAGWVGSIRPTKLTSTTPGAPIANNIGGKPVRVFDYRNCVNMVSSPVLNEYTNLQDVTFAGCKSLSNIGSLPPNLRTIQYTFKDTAIANIPSTIPYSKIEKAANAFDGTKITQTPDLSSFTKLTDINYMFNGCSRLTTVNGYPPNITSMAGTFMNCTSLASVPTIPSTVNNLYRTFYGCTNLTGEIKIECEVLDAASQAFNNTQKNIAIICNADYSNWDACYSLASPYSNVYFPIHANADSMNLIRCLNDSTYTDDTMGGYVKLLIDYSLEPASGYDIYYYGVDMRDENDTVISIGNTLTGIYNGSTIQNLQVGDILPSSGRLILVDPLSTYLGNSNTSGNFVARLKSYFEYDSEQYIIRDGKKYLTLTEANFAIDVNSDGTAVGILMEAPDNEDGLYSTGIINKHNAQTSPTNAISVVDSNGNENFHVDWDGSVEHAGDGQKNVASYISTTLSTGRLSVAVVQIYGNVCQMTLVVYNTGSVAVGSDLYTGKISNYRPKGVTNGTGLYSNSLFAAQLNASGGITIRKMTGTSNPSSSSMLYVSFTYILDRSTLP